MDTKKTMFALYDAHKDGLLTNSSLKSNLVAGTIVGIVALPLAMAFAIASGVKPEQGIITAIIAGLIVGVFGGTRTQIAGPTGAFVVILATITAQYGVAGLQIATLMAGCILCLMSFLKLGNAIKFIPYSVIVGFTSGIGVIIFLGQWKDFFGLPLLLPLDLDFHEKFILLIQYLPHMDPPTAMLSGACLAIIIIAPRYITTIPSPLIAMLFAAFVHFYFGLESIATIGSVFGTLSSSLPRLSIPDYSQVHIQQLIGPALTIALLGAIESLLSASAADSLSGTKHKANPELMGQGLANIIAPLFGGFASTGAIARTVTNIRHGGTSPLAAITHSIVLLLILVFLAPLAAHIPLCALAAILFVVAFHMSDIPSFMHILKRAPRNDVMILLTTFLLTIFTDLVIAVAAGVILAMLFFMMRINQTVEVQQNIAPHPDGDGLVYTIDGPFFFGAAEKIEQALAVTNSEPKFVVFRLNKMPFIDMTGLDILSKIIEKYRKKDVRVYVCEANPKVAEKITRFGIMDKIHQQIVTGRFEEIRIQQPI